MPFAGFKDFNACVATQLQKHSSWDKERAKRFCGAIKARVEDSSNEKLETDSQLMKHFQDLYMDTDGIEIDLDAILKNQPIAKEGVLPYGEFQKLKRWDNLKNFETVQIPVIDDHPVKENGNDGLWNNEKVYGFATLKICPKEKKVLCADLDLDDDAPVRNGYSLGYTYEPILKTGSKNGVPFNMIQNILDIDHLALTNFPRDDHAMRQTDNDSNNKHNTERNNISVGYDHFKTFFNRSLPDRKKLTGVKNMGNGDKDGKTDPIIEADGGKISKKEALLLQRIQKLEDEKEFDAKNKANLETVKKERDSEKEAREKVEKERDALRAKLVKVDLDTIEVEFNIKKADFDKKSSDFIAGALFMGRKLKANDSLKPGETKHKKKDEEGQDTETDANDFDHRNFVWDNDKQEMVDAFTGKSIKELKG